VSDDPLSSPLSELGHISLHAQQLSQSTGRLAAGAEQVSRDLQHGAEVFAPIFAELTGELRRLRLATGRSAWALVAATVALVIATLVMAWPMWFPQAARQLSTAAALTVTPGLQGMPDSKLLMVAGLGLSFIGSLWLAWMAGVPWILPSRPRYPRDVWAWRVAVAMIPAGFLLQLLGTLLSP